MIEYVINLLTGFSVTLIIVLLGIACGCYIRDGQDDHKREVPLGRKFHYTLAGLTFLVAMVLGTSVIN